MADSYTVDTAALTAHASVLRSLADDLTSALVATDLTNGCYGGQADSFVSALQAVAQTGQETLQAGAAALEADATDITTAARNYDNQETATKTGFGQIETGLGQIETGLGQIRTGQIQTSQIKGLPA